MWSDSPKIHCEPAEADIGDVNVTLRCHVNARPSPTSLYWLIDSNVTVVAMGDSDGSSQYFTLVRVS